MYGCVYVDVCRKYFYRYLSLGRFKILLTSYGSNARGAISSLHFPAGGNAKLSESQLPTAKTTTIVSVNFSMLLTWNIECLMISEDAETAIEVSKIEFQFYRCLHKSLLFSTQHIANVN